MPPKCCSFAAVCALAVAILAVPAYADEECQLAVVEDEMVLQSLPGFNFGRWTTYGGLGVGTDYSGNAARSYLQWDLSALDAAKPVSKAKLRAFLSRRYYPVEDSVEAHLCADDTWTAGAITWDSAPQPAAAAAAVVSPPLNAGQYHEWDVTQLVVGELAGDKKLSVVLMASGEGATVGTWKYFAEREFNGGDTEPLLVVEQGGKAADVTPPELEVSCKPDSLWPPNHKLVTTTVIVEASDDSGQPPTVELLSAVSDEPDDAKGGGDGHTTGDVVIVDDNTLKLRAERSGTGNGRTYTLTYTATDAAGNQTTRTCTVVVPHDKGAK